MRYTITHNTAPARDAADYGIRAAVLTVRSLTADTLEFDTGECVTATPQFAYHDTITLRLDGTVRFSGRVTAITRAGTADSESLHYTISGPWYDLEHLVFEQIWRFGKFTKKENSPPAPGAEPPEEEADDKPPLPSVKTVEEGISRILLGYALDGSRVRADAIIRAVLDYAIGACGVALQIGQLSPQLYIPAEDLRDRTCAEIITKVMHWHPAHCSRIDYATTPPTFSITDGTGFAAVTLDVQKDLLQIPSLTPRYDLQPTGVFITYTRTNTGTDDNGQTVSMEERLLDKWPLNITGRELRCLRFAMDLQGSQSQSLVQKLTTETYDPYSLDWWKKRTKWMRDKEASFSLGVVTVEAEDKTQKPLPYVITDGAVADWMPVKTVAVNVSAKIHFVSSRRVYNDAPDITPSNTKTKTQGDQTVSERLLTTDSPTRIFKMETASLAAEDPIPGFARAFFEQLQPLRHEGQIELAEPDWSARVGVGQPLNLAGLRPEWATMRALVQGVSISLDSGTSTLEIGPPAWLQPGDWLDLLRGNRQRTMQATLISRRTTGKAPTDELTLPGTAATGSTTTGGPPVVTNIDISGGDASHVALNGLHVRVSRTAAAPFNHSTLILADGVFITGAGAAATLRLTPPPSGGSAGWVEITDGTGQKRTVIGQLSS